MKRTTIASILALGLALLCAPQAFATVAVTAATGASAISADTTGGSFTGLTGPTITEGTAGEIGAGSIILNAPVGFIFNTNVSVTVSVTKLTVASTTASVTTNSVTITVTAPGSSGKASITWSGIQVRPSAGTPLAGGNMTRSGTSSFTDNSSNYGTMTEVVGAATKLAFTTQPGSATAGSVFGQQPVVKSEDQFGNSSTVGLPKSLTLAVTLTAGTGPLQGTTSLAIGSSSATPGVATFTNLRIDVSGTNKQLTAAASGLTSGLSSVFTVSPAGVSTLAVSGYPSPTAAGNSGTVTVTAKDAFGNTVPTYTGTVRFTSSDGAATLPADYTFQNSDNGAQSFSVTLKTSGSQSITVRDTISSSVTGTQSGITVNKASTTTTVGSSANPSDFGQSVTFTATVATVSGLGTPTGTVVFKDGATALATNTLSAGQATLTTASLSIGSHSITAIYSGDASYTNNTSAALTQTVNKVDTTTTLISSVSPTVFGQSVSFTATVTPVAGSGIPTGTVIFKDGSTALSTNTLSAGQAIFATASLSAGSHTITAVYNGDASYTNSTSAGLTQSVGAADTATTATSSINPSVFGQSMTFTATVAAVAPGGGTPTGTVTFTIDGVAQTPASLNSSGKATISVSSLSVSNHTVTADYSGSSNHNASSGALAGGQTVNQANTTTAVGSSANPSVFGQSVTFTATVNAVAPGSGTPTGSVVFKDGTTALATNALSAGQATLTTTSLSGGSHSITAAYTGDANYTNSTSGAVVQTVNKASTTTTVGSSANPSVFGQSVTFTATVSPSAATGVVIFKDGATTLATNSLSAGQAAYSTSVLSTGNHSITAVYTGDANYTNSTSAALTQTVGKAGTTTTVGSSANPSAPAQPVTFTATVSAVTPGSGTPTGTAIFKDGATALATNTLTSGQAAYTTSLLSTGNHSITAVYNGDANFTTSTSATFTQTVNRLDTTTTLISSVSPTVFGQSVSFTATVTPVSGSGTPTGTVIFKDGATALSTNTLSAGQATFATTSLSTGSHTITAAYSGDGSYTNSTSAGLTQSVGAADTATTATSSINPSVFGQSMTFTATVAAVAPGGGTPTGTVTFTIDGVAQTPASLNSSGKATFGVSSLSVSNHTVTADYSGSSNHNASSSVLAGGQTVNKANTSTTITSSANPSTFGLSMTFTATVSAVSPGAGIPSGSVTFTVDGVDQSPVSLNASGQAIFSPSALSVGSHTISAASDGDASFNSGVSTNFTQTVNPAPLDHFAVGTISAQTAGAAFTMTVTAQDQFNNTVTSFTGTVSIATTAGTISPIVSGAFVSGVRTQSVTVTQAGTGQTITVTRTGGSETGASNPFDVNPGALHHFAFNSISGPQTAGTAFNVTMTAQDQNSNTVTSFAGTVNLATTAGAINPTISGLFAGGVRTESVTVTQTGTGKTITATRTGGTETGVSNGFTVSPGAAAAFTVSGFPSPTTAGSTGSVTVTVNDSFGNTVTTYNGTVAFSSSDSQATLPANYTFASGDNGTHTFSATLKTAGSQSLSVTDTLSPAVTGSQSGITVNPTTATKLGFTVQPGNATAGAAFGTQPVVKTQDQYGNNSTVGLPSNLTVTNVLTSGTGPLQGTTSMNIGRNGGNGVATFTNLRIDIAGNNKQLTASASGFGAALSSIFTVNPAAAATITVAGYASPTTAGVSHNFTVTIKDAFGNTATAYTGTIAFTSTDSQATLPANYTFVGADNGVHTFSATLKTTGTRSITATDTVTGSVTGTQSSIQVTPAVASTLIVAGYASPTTAGVAHNFTVTAKDAFGNTATNYAGTVGFTSTDGQATLPANYTFAGADNGVHTFSATLKTAGTRSITATDTVTASITGTQSSIQVIPATASTLAVAGYPSPTTAGVTQSFTVTARDAFGNTATNYAGTVGFTGTDGQAALPANYTFVGADNGVHTFSATLRTAGTRSITATDTVTGSITGTQGSIQVNATTASKLVFTTQPGSATAGAAFGTQPIVKTQDTFGNNSTVGLGSSLTVTITLTAGTGPLQGTTTLDIGTATGNGTATFAGLRIDTSGSGKQLTASAGGLTNAVSVAFNVSPAAASTLVVAGYASPTTAGVAHNFTVTARDAFGNTATNYTGTVAFTSTDSQATLPANYTFVSADGGVHTFSATFKTTGTQSVTATDTVTASITGTQSGVTVNPTTATKLAFTTQPSSATAGAAFGQQPVVKTQDTFGNNSTVGLGSSVTVAITLTAGTGPLQGTTALDLGTAAGNGIAPFTNLRIDTSGSGKQLTASAAGLTNAVSAAFSVSPAAASTLVVAGYPSPTVAGVAHNFTVTARDAFGNTATNYAGTIGFTSTDGQATLPANYTFVSADSGVHTFSATLKTAGSRSITVTDTVTGTITGTQSSIQVTPATASTLVVAGYPSPTTAGVAHNFTVTANDAFGNTITNYAGTVSFTSTDGQATLPANYTFVIADHGVHTFSATLKTAGTRSITATDTVTGSITGTQGSIQVTPVAASTLTVAGYASPTTAGTAQSFTVTAKDAFGNTATNYAGTVAFTSADSQATLPANYTFVSADGGVHTFSATLKTSGTRSITATDTVTGSITGTQSGITVNPAGLDHFAIAAIGTQTAGTAFNVTATAQDQFNNTVTNFTGTVDLTTTAGTISPTTSGAFTSGQRTQSVTVTLSGSARTITVTRTGGSETGTSNPFTVNAGALHHFGFDVISNPQTAGTAFNIVIAAQDQNNNTVTSFTNTVNLSTTAGTISPSTSGVFSAGLRTQSVTVTLAGTNKTITATRTGGSETGTSNGFDVNPGAFVKLQLLVPGETAAPATATGKTGTPAAETANAPFSITVNAVDANWNVVNTVVDFIQITSTDSTAMLPRNAVLVAGTKGYTFAFGKGGTYTITATDGSDGGKPPSTSPSITVGNSPVTAATGGTAISADTVGGAWTALTGPVYTESSAGNVGTGTIILNVPAGFIFDTGCCPRATIRINGDPSSLTKNINDNANGGSIPLTVTTTQVIFTVTSSSSGTPNVLTWQDLRVRPTASTPLAIGMITKSGTCAMVGVSNNFTSFGQLVEVGVALDHFAFATISSPQATGTAFNITIYAQDQFGDTATSFSGTVDLSTTAGTITPSVSGAFVSGQRTESVTVTANGANQTITATRTGGTETGASNPFTVCTPTTIDGQPSGQTVCSGDTASFIVTASTGLTFQWRKNGTNISDGPTGNGSTYSGATTATLQINNVAAADAVSAAAGFDCVVIGACGLPVTSARAGLSVNPSPTATVSGSGTICAGQSAMIQAALTGTGPWTVTWSDSITQNNVAASPATRTVSPGSTTTYTVTAVSDSICAAGTLSGGATITVNAIPAAPTVGNNGPICSGQTLNLTASTVSGATYSWTGPNSFISSAQNPSVANATASAAGTYSVTVTVSGCISTAATTTATINTAPTATCPADIVVTNAPGLCSSNVTFAVGTTGNPTPTVECKIGSTVITSPHTFAVGTNTVNCTASNSCGISSCSFKVVVVDNQPPTISNCPTNLTVSCASAVPVADTNLVAATDSCGAVTVSFVSDVISNQTCPSRYMVIRTYRATDSSGNSAICSQTITVNDTTAPAISSSPSNVTVSCASQVPPADNTAVIANDNCGGTVTITHDADAISNQSCSNRYTITRTYHAADSCGNSNSVTQTITVDDETAPTISCPADVTTNTDAGLCYATGVILGGPITSDNCGGTVTLANNAPAQFPPGTNLVVWTATDGCGNSSTGTQQVIVAHQPLVFAGLQVVTPAIEGGTLSWQAAPGAGATYKVYQGTASGAENFGASALSTTDLSAFIAPLYPGSNSAITYFFVVRATDACGLTESNVVEMSVQPQLDPNKDQDGDGLPNGFEQQYGLNPFDASDGSKDADGDGLSNLQEFLAGTDPTNNASCLHITSVVRTGNDIRVSWAAMGGKSYVLQTNSVPVAGFGDCSSVIAVPGLGETTTNCLDVGAATNAAVRYYRVRLAP